MPTSRIRVADGIEVGGDAPLLLIAGPDVIESEAHALRMATALAEIARDRGIPLVYKSSFDKANRTSIGSFRGPGLEEGLRVLDLVKRETGLPVTIAENPLDCVVLGSGRVLEELDRMRGVLFEE